MTGGWRRTLDSGRAARPLEALDRMSIRSAGEGEELDWPWLIRPYRWLFDARADRLVATRVRLLDFYGSQQSDVS